MNLLAHHLKVRALACSLMATLAVCPSYGQTGKPADVFSPVPEASRPRLIERLDSSLKYYRTKQWDKQYDLLDKQSGFLLGGSKEEYVEGRIANAEKDEALIDFVPRLVTYDESFGEWEIEGCSKWRKEGEVKAAIRARLLEGEWFFSLIGIELFLERVGDNAWRADSRKPIPCVDKAANNSFNPTPR